MIHPTFLIETEHCTQCINYAFDDAAETAKGFRHEFVTPEHLFFAISCQPQFTMYCNENGIDTEAMNNEINNYLESLDVIDPEDEYEFRLSVKMIELKNLLTIGWNERHIMHLNNDSEIEPISVLVVLEAMYSLENSFAEYILQKYLGDDVVAMKKGLRSHYSLDLNTFLERWEKMEIENSISGELSNEDFEIEDINIEEGTDFIPDDELQGLNLPPNVKPRIIKAVIKGDGIDLQNLDSNEIYKKLMASAGRLMGAINSMGEGQKSNENNNKPKHEPWEELVSSISETYLYQNPLIGREAELKRTIRVLCRKDKNNPLFIGEPGVGKTALIYGLAKMIAEDNVPHWLKGKHIYGMDMAAMVAGTSFHGEFEKRMKAVLEGAKRKGNCIIYIDEIHSIMGSGGGNNSINTAVILKPYLDDGTVRFIGSTTYQDFNKVMANNKAIVRRFQQIDIKEPSVEETIEIINGLLPNYENHHGVKYTDDAVRYAVEQSDRLIHDRFLPDKAIDLMDEAGAYLQQNPLLNKNGEPKQKRYQKVSPDIIKLILTDVCRIDAKALTSESNADLKDLDKRMLTDIYGQDEAIRSVVRSVMMSKAGLMEPNKPIASLLFVGPTGVGKTEVCKVLAQELGVELVRFDMSEYSEKHAISKLIGSPAGYVGYDEGGLLTDAIRKTPNCVLLLDEIEKAHTDIYNILLQVMDYAKLTDNKGNKADFRNVILVMTSNAGAQYAGQAAIGFSGGQSKGQAMMASVKKTFKPEFLNRLSGTVVFNDMDEHMASLILDKKLRQLKQRLAAKNVTMTLKEDAREFLLHKGFNPQYGAREMDRVIQQYLTPLLMEEILFGKLKKGGEISIDLQSLKTDTGE